MDVHLLVVEGKHQGLLVKLPPTQFVIGRDPTCHLRPASADVSRFHCAIACLGRQIMVRDLKSTNGTFVNDKRVTGTVRVRDRDVLQVGPLKFRFQFGTEPVAAGPAESGLQWLVRNPDAQESRALDPTKVTDIISCVSALPGEAPPLVSARKRGGKSQATAVAGAFLREYLHRRGRPTKK